MKSAHLFSALALWVIICIAGCSALYKDYGRIVPDGEAEAAFEDSRVDPDLNYYSSGPAGTPNALMGLKKDYVLDSDLWKKIEMTPDIFREIVSSMQSRASRIARFQYGFAILDNRGRRIGIWYSLLDAGTFIKMKGEKTVEVHTPPLNLYEREELIDYDRRKD